MNQRPTSSEYAPYYSTYIRLVPEEGDLSQILKEQLNSTYALLSDLTDEQGNYRYADGKWSVKEVLGHITDNERIMSYRLLRIARGDKTPLPGYDQDTMMEGAPFNQCSVAFLLEDYKAVRQATLTLLSALTEEAWIRQGTASDSVFSARALACVIVGHELHHLNVLYERYGLKRL
ncbi:DinB family protein [Paenibacillus sp. UNC451MF]|uniref:DinB family protein n=1 Tax=Paenibacillus sp. UNC451MF TaxID=1449063 RepID=UPI00048A4485|nr:DinB family protein [Paenibacillus sp. UNC451MF]